ncbi:class I SAM-dependent methyltransferase [Desulfolithobacter sp.]
MNRLEQRIPEPELMEDEIQAKAYAEADFSAPNEQFVALFADKFPDFLPPARVLDLGCGPADILIRFVRRFPGASCVGVDGSMAMLQHGIEAVHQAQLSRVIDLRCCLLPSPDLPGEERFQVILSNSLLHHLSDPQILWQTIRDTGASGCRVLVMDLFRPASVEEARNIVETYSGTEPEILQQDFYNSLLASWRPDEVREQLRLAGLDFQCGFVSDRHLGVWGVLR